MNSSRRAIIDEIKDSLDEIRDKIDEVRDEEQESYDNLPESFQGGEQGEKMQSAIDTLDEAMSSIDEVSEYLDTAARHEQPNISQAERVVHSAAYPGQTAPVALHRAHYSDRPYQGLLRARRRSDRRQLYEEHRGCRSCLRGRYHPERIPDSL